MGAANTFIHTDLFITALMSCLVPLADHVSSPLLKPPTPLRRSQMVIELTEELMGDNKRRALFNEVKAIARAHRITIKDGPTEHLMETSTSTSETHINEEVCVSLSISI